MIEFRHHSGTVNAAKITNWICFLYEFIEECKKLNDLEAGAQMASQETWTEMQKKLAGMFESNGLACLDDICQHFGWRRTQAAPQSQDCARKGWI